MHRRFPPPHRSQGDACVGRNAVACPPRPPPPPAMPAMPAIARHHHPVGRQMNGSGFKPSVERIVVILPGIRHERWRSGQAAPTSLPPTRQASYFVPQCHGDKCRRLSRSSKSEVHHRLLGSKTLKPASDPSNSIQSAGIVIGNDSPACSSGRQTRDPPPRHTKHTGVEIGDTARRRLCSLC